MWTKYHIEEGKVYYWSLGHLEFWVTRKKNEWMIASKYQEDSTHALVIGLETSFPEEMAWNTFISKPGGNLLLRPALPNRPLLIKPKNPYKLLGHMQVNLFFYIPIWVQFYAEEVNKTSLMHEEPTRILSNTWFGEAENGVLSYSLERGFYSEKDEQKGKDNLVICPVTIKNDTTEPLKYQRLSLHVEHLNIYKKDFYLCTNQVSIRFKGADKTSDVMYGERVPKYFTGYSHIGGPRIPPSLSLLRKSFHFIRNFSH